VSEFLNSLRDVKANWKLYPKWEQQQDDKEAQRQELHKSANISKEQLEEADKFGRTVIDAVDVMDRNSEDKVENVEMATAPIISFVPMLAIAVPILIGVLLGKKNIKYIEKTLNPEYRIKVSEALKTKMNDELAKVSGGSYSDSDKIRKGFNFGDFHGFDFFDNIKRYKKQYSSPEALNIINKYLEQYKNEKANKGFIRSITLTAGAAITTLIGATVGSIIWTTGLEKQSARIARYQAREKELKDPRNFVIYTPEQIQQAKEIAKTMPDIPDKKQPNWFKSIGSLLRDNKHYKNWKKNNDNASNINYAGSLTPEQLQNAEADKDVLCRVIRKVNDNAEDYAEHMETTAGTLLSCSLIGGAGIGKLISKIPGVEKATEKSLRKFLEKENIKKKITNLFSTDLEKIVKFSNPKLLAAGSAIGATLLTIPISLYLNKYASRIGRYVAKKELVEDPKNFVSYDSEQMDSVKQVKAPKKKQGFFHRLAEDIVFIPKAIKLSLDYSKYKKHDLKDRQKLQEALKQVEINPDQTEKAKNLQSKVFKSFEKVDEMSQKYSEDMEAATTMFQQLSPLAAMAAIYAPIVALGVAVVKGKVTGAKVVKKISGILAKATLPLKTKLAKKTVLDITNHIESKYAKYAETYADKIRIKNPQTKPKVDLEAIWKEMTEEANALEDTHPLKSLLLNIKNPKDPDFMESIFKSIENVDENTLKHIVNKAFKEKDPLEFKELPVKDIKTMAGNINKIIKNLPKDELKTLYDKLINLGQQDPETFAKFVKDNQKSLLMSPMVKKFMYAMGISYPVGILGVFYLMQLYFSELQRKAGKIGTMKAIEELDNPINFADVSQTQNNINPEPETNSNYTNNSIVNRFIQKQASQNIQ